MIISILIPIPILENGLIKGDYAMNFKSIMPRINLEEIDTIDELNFATELVESSIPAIKSMHRSGIVRYFSAKDLAGYPDDFDEDSIDYYYYRNDRGYLTAVEKLAVMASGGSMASVDYVMLSKGDSDIYQRMYRIYMRDNSIVVFTREHLYPFNIVKAEIIDTNNHCESITDMKKIPRDAIIALFRVSFMDAFVTKGPFK